MRKTYAFDDVLLVPQKSDIESRKEVDLSTSIGHIKLSIPILSSPMDTVSERGMLNSIAQLGGMGIAHRYNEICKQIQMTEGIQPAAAAVGISGDYQERVSALYASGIHTICLDVAHGHHVLMERALKTLRDKYCDELTIIAGNVATPEGFSDLAYWGADAIRVGIGGGSICSTRIQTGHGVPTLQSVVDCRPASDAVLIADGGIKSAGDIVKCLALGADAVMLGSLLAGTKESPGLVHVSQEGSKYKVYRGMASREAQKDWRGQASSLEGVSTTIPYKGSVTHIVQDLIQNVRSGFSYSGARNLRELQLKVKFITQSAASQVESNTHIMALR